MSAGRTLNEAQLDAVWPACTGPSARVELYGEGIVTVSPIIVEATLALDAALSTHSYETRRADTGAYVCRDKTGQPGVKSKHARKIALDLNWTSNPYGRRLVTDMPRAMVDDILAIRTRDGWQVWTWGGDWSGNKDAMHYQGACAPRNLATGIDPATWPGHRPPPKPIVDAPSLQEAVFYAKQFRLGAPGVELNPDAIRFAQEGLNNWYARFARLTGTPAPPRIPITGLWDQTTRDHVALLQKIMDRAEPGTGWNELGTMGPKTWNAVFP